jgi:hypothetical protein
MKNLAALENVLSVNGAAFDNLWDVLESFHDTNSEIVDYLKDTFKASSKEIHNFRVFINDIYESLTTLISEDEIQWASWHEVQTLLNPTVDMV